MFHDRKGVLDLPRLARTYLVAILFAAPMFAGASAIPVTQDKRTPTISFESAAVVVSGATPNAKVILFAVERRASDYAMRTGEFSATLESDAGGSSRYELQRSMAPTSIAVAVDTVSGEFAVASPGGAQVDLRPEHALRVKKKAAQEFDAFELDAHWVKAIWVRPGHGAWKLSLMDGSAGDDSSVAGTVRAGVGHMKAIGAGAEPPGEFRLRDVLIAVDPYTMSVVATAVNE